MQRAGEEYVLEEPEDELNGFEKEFIAFSREIMYRTGYVYRYWNYYTGESSKEIYQEADARIMGKCRLGFHTLDVEMAIDGLKEKMGIYSERKK